MEAVSWNTPPSDSWSGSLTMDSPSKKDRPELSDEKIEEESECNNCINERTHELGRASYVEQVKATAGRNIFQVENTNPKRRRFEIYKKGSVAEENAENLSVGNTEIQMEDIIDFSNAHSIGEVSQWHPHMLSPARLREIREQSRKMTNIPKTTETGIHFNRNRPSWAVTYWENGTRKYRHFFVPDLSPNTTRAVLNAAVKLRHMIESAKQPNWKLPPPGYGGYGMLGGKYALIKEADDAHANVQLNQKLGANAGKAFLPPSPDIHSPSRCEYGCIDIGCPYQDFAPPSPSSPPSPSDSVTCSPTLRPTTSPKSKSYNPPQISTYFLDSDFVTNTDGSLSSPLHGKKRSASADDGRWSLEAEETFRTAGSCNATSATSATSPSHPTCNAATSSPFYSATSIHHTGVTTRRKNFLLHEIAECHYNWTHSSNQSLAAQWEQAIAEDMSIHPISEKPKEQCSITAMKKEGHCENNELLFFSASCENGYDDVMSSFKKEDEWSFRGNVTFSPDLNATEPESDGEEECSIRENTLLDIENKESMNGLEKYLPPDTKQLDDCIGDPMGCWYFEGKDWLPKTGAQLQDFSYRHSYESHWDAPPIEWDVWVTDDALLEERDVRGESELGDKASVFHALQLNRDEQRNNSREKTQRNQMQGPQVLSQSDINYFRRCGGIHWDCDENALVAIWFIKGKWHSRVFPCESLNERSISTARIEAESFLSELKEIVKSIQSCITSQLNPDVLFKLLLSKGTISDVPPLQGKLKTYVTY